MHTYSITPIFSPSLLLLTFTSALLARVERCTRCSKVCHFVSTGGKQTTLIACMYLRIKMKVNEVRDWQCTFRYTYIYSSKKAIIYTTHQISVCIYTTTCTTYDLMIATTATKNRSGLERLHPYKHTFVHTYVLYILRYIHNTKYSSK